MTLHGRTAMHKRGCGLAVLMAAGLGGCVLDPAAPLIPLPERPATARPSEVPERLANGFPNILADPAPVAGLPRSAKAQAADTAAMEAERRAAAAETGLLPPASFAGAIGERRRNHVAEARREIEATGQLSGGPVRDVPASLARPRAPQEAPLPPGEPLDPTAPPPRAVGVPPFTGAPASSD